MAARFTLASATALATLIGCAAHGSSDTGNPNGVDSGGSGSGDDGTGGPVFYDSGPPATIGGEDAGGGGGGEGGTGSEGGAGCTSASDCPGAGKPNDSVACTNSACSLTCNGEFYDVNADPNDGCEIPDTCASLSGSQKCPIDDHTSALAIGLGDYDCTDGSFSGKEIDGEIPSDARGHVPAIDGFIAGTGAAPDVYSIHATGGSLCQDDANFTLTMLAPTRQSACYSLTLLTDKNGGGQTCTTSASGVCNITNGSGSYSDGSTIYLTVTKLASCTAAGFPDDAKYKITGHL